MYPKNPEHVARTILTRKRLRLRVGLRERIAFPYTFTVDVGSTSSPWIVNLRRRNSRRLLSLTSELSGTLIVSVYASLGPARIDCGPAR